MRRITHLDIRRRAPYPGVMRVTLDIDEPVLLAIKSLARQTGRTMGKVASDLIAAALKRDEPELTRDGIPTLRPGKERGPATLELVNELRDGDMRRKSSM